MQHQEKQPQDEVDRVKQRVARNVRRLRVAAGIAQDQLALDAGLERAWVGHLESGKKNPTLLTLAKITAALKCDIAELFLPVEDVTVAELRRGRKPKSPQDN